MKSSIDSKAQNLNSNGYVFKSYNFDEMTLFYIIFDIILNDKLL